MLTAVVGWLRERITPNALVWINRASGTVLLIFGTVAILVALGVV